ncbi:MAG: phospholipid carrier-dependent glycosyltransferase, partial [Niabella sp.]
MNKYLLHYLKKLKSMPKEIYILLAIAFILRFIGITYGLPLPINTDEPVLISTTVNLKYNLNPDRFDWPHLYYYINAVAYGIFFVIRQTISLFYRFEVLYEDSALFAVSRFLTVIFGTLTVIPVYYFAKKIFNSKQSGLIAALILTFLPIHVSESHLAKLDIAQTFFIAVAFYFAARIYYTNRLRDYIYFGIITGLATSIKYNGVLIYLVLLVALYFHHENLRQFFQPKILLTNLKNLIVAGVSTIIAFYLGTPFALIE